PICQDADTGVAVAVTDSPGTCAVFDSGRQVAGATHIHVGSSVSCSAPGAGPATPTGQASVATVIAQPAGTQPNALLTVPAQPPPGPAAARVPVPVPVPPVLPVPLLPGGPAVTVQPGV